MAKQPVSVNGVVRWRDVGLADEAHRKPKERKMVVLRHEIGDVLRDVRQRQGRTLREVSHSARVSLGYLSEVERGQKEADPLDGRAQAISLTDAGTRQLVAAQTARKQAFHELMEDWDVEDLTRLGTLIAELNTTYSKDNW